jgi:ribosomal protein L32
MYDMLLSFYTKRYTDQKTENYKNFSEPFFNESETQKQQYQNVSSQESVFQESQQRNFTFKEKLDAFLDKLKEKATTYIPLIIVLVIGRGIIKFFNSDLGKEITPFITGLSFIVLFSVLLWNLIRYQNKNQENEENNRTYDSNDFNLNKCPNCGNSVLSEDKFCSTCGYKLVNTEESMTLREKIAFLISIVPFMIMLFWAFALLILH